MLSALPASLAHGVATSGELLNIPDVYEDPRFDPSADRDTGYRTQNLLCMPLFDAGGRVFGVAQLLNKDGGQKPFDVVDERRFQDFAAKMGVIMESWAHMAGHVSHGDSIDESSGKSLP